MGIELVKVLAGRYAARLSQRALVVLLYMSLQALDRPNGKGQPARLYFAGWEPLALALGYDGLTKAAEEKIRRAIKELRELGLIEPVAGHARAGTRQCYRILIAGLAADGPSPTDSEGLCPTDSEGQEPHRFGGKSPTDSEGPRTNEEGCEDLSQELHPPFATELPTARANLTAEDEAMAQTDFTRLHTFIDDGNGYCRGCHLIESHIRHYEARSA